jgi:hypothetical protein
MVGLGIQNSMFVFPVLHVGRYKVGRGGMANTSTNFASSPEFECGYYDTCKFGR